MLYSEAALLAKKAGVKRLWLTHFSPAVNEPELGIDVARAIFPDAECGCDGKNIDIPYED